jgi:hypothetical protein
MENNVENLKAEDRDWINLVSLQRCLKIGRISLTIVRKVHIHGQRVSLFSFDFEYDTSLSREAKNAQLVQMSSNYFLTCVRVINDPHLPRYLTILEPACLTIGREKEWWERSEDLSWMKGDLYIRSKEPWPSFGSRVDSNIFFSFLCWGGAPVQGLGCLTVFCCVLLWDSCWASLTAFELGGASAQLLPVCLAIPLYTVSPFEFPTKSNR